MWVYRALFGIGVDAWAVIQLRMLKMTRGAPMIAREGMLMWSEKIGAVLDEQTALARGETFPGRVARWRFYVAANVRRLTNSKKC